MKSFIRLATLSVCFSLVGPVALARCGEERWSVKTGTDSDANSVDLNSAIQTTVSAMAGLVGPGNDGLPADNRVSPTELKTWKIDATLTEFKIENNPKSGDSDYHLVLQDSAGNTMIAEIPSPKCVDGSSPFLTGITNARNEFDAQFDVTGRFQHPNVTVHVIGVGFFDFHHGQTGVALNAVELHPVLDIKFDE